MTSLNGKKFAVVIDEAHSSQSGEGKDAIKKVLSFGNLGVAEQSEPQEPDEEDEINSVVTAQQQQKGRSPHISYFAFTATPKAKTLETLGIQIDEPDGSVFLLPFSLHSMRQAIKEGFTKDVLKNHTTYKSYFNLIKTVTDEPHYGKKKAAYILESHVDLHEHAIRSKTEIMVDHFTSRLLT